MQKNIRFKYCIYYYILYIIYFIYYCIRFIYCISLFFSNEYKSYTVQGIKLHPYPLQEHCFTFFISCNLLLCINMLYILLAFSRCGFHKIIIYNMFNSTTLWRRVVVTFFEWRGYEIFMPSPSNKFQDAFRLPIGSLKASTAGGFKFLLGEGNTPLWRVLYKSLDAPACTT